MSNKQVRLSEAVDKIYRSYEFYKAKLNDPHITIVDKSYYKGLINGLLFGLSNSFSVPALKIEGMVLERLKSNGKRHYKW